MAVVWLRVWRAGCSELCGGKRVQSCVRGRGREGCITAPMVQPVTRVWEASGEQKIGVNPQQSEGYLSPKATQNLRARRLLAEFWRSVVCSYSLKA